jgi:transposase
VGNAVAKAPVDCVVLGATLAARPLCQRQRRPFGLVAAALPPLGGSVVVMAATGGPSESAVAGALQAAGFAGAVGNPKPARHFAKSRGRLAKTARIDAEALAELAATLLRRSDRMRFIRPLPNAPQRELAALLTRRRQRRTMRGSERLRLQPATAKVRPSSEALIAAIPRPTRGDRRADASSGAGTLRTPR